MSSSYDFIIVGAGITGASAAYWLKKKGIDKVLVIEKGAAPACSNTGKSCAMVRTFYTIPVMARLAQIGVGMFANLTEELGNDGGFRQTGFIQILPADWVETTAEILKMHQSLGIDTGFVDPSEYERKYPWLNTEDIGAIVYENDSGYADPVQTTEAFAEAFQGLGGEIRFRTPCRGLVREGDRVTGVLLDEGPLEAGFVINAAGPWAKFLAESIGLELPMVAMREQDIVVEIPPDRGMPSTPVSTAIEAVYMRPIGVNRWLFGRGFPKEYFEVDPYNYKLTADNDFEIDLIDRWVKRMPPVQGARLIESYAALYDVTPDWIPFMGPRSGIEGYCDANGGGGHAFKTGPALTRELVQWIVDGEVADDLRQLSYDRIPAGDLFRQKFGGNRV